MTKRELVATTAAVLLFYGLFAVSYEAAAWLVAGVTLPVSAACMVAWWHEWRVTKVAEERRRERYRLGLPETATRWLERWDSQRHYEDGCGGCDDPFNDTCRACSHRWLLLQGARKIIVAVADERPNQREGSRE